MPVKLTPGLIKTLEIYLESMDEYQNLVEGLRHVIWAYLEDHIDHGMDPRISGNFLKNFDSLMELIEFIGEEE